MLALPCAWQLSFAWADNAQSGLPTTASGEGIANADKRIAVGKALFFDKRFSADGAVSCASCHQPERAFTDGRTLAQGVAGRLGSRNTPSLLNAVFNTSQFWDGRRTSLEQQAPDPFVNPLEHGLKDDAALLQLLRRIPFYRNTLADAFNVAPEAVEIAHASRAIAAYEAR